MAKPKVFVSSTYYDLKHVRASVEVFIEGLGFDPILAEYGAIAYDPSQPLDDSCYREAQTCDIFVLIVGGRYGSIASSQQKDSKQREEDLESITRREFTKAHDADIPVYILIDAGVYSEYQTYLRNKDNEAIRYAHVDSTKIFRFIEFVHSRQRNNPIHPFEKGGDIEFWLRDQWSGLFQDLLRQRQDNRQFADLTSQIRQLEAVNKTLKLYLESVLETVSPDKSGDLIKRENLSLSRSTMIERARDNAWFEHMMHETDLSTEEVLNLNLSIASVSDIIQSYSDAISDITSLAGILEPLNDYKEARRDFNRMREMIGLRPVRFTQKFKEELSEKISDLLSDPSYLPFRGFIPKSGKKRPDEKSDSVSSE